MPKSTNPLDYIVLSGIPSPGLLTWPSLADVPSNWDERKAMGSSGAIVVFTGEGLAKFGVRVTLYDEEDERGWPPFYALVKQSHARPKALAIHHPDLAEMGIVSAVVTNRVQRHRAADGSSYYDIKFSQYRKPAPMLTKPDGSDATPAEPTVEDDMDRMIQGLTNTLQELAR